MASAMLRMSTRRASAFSRVVPAAAAPSGGELLPVHRAVPLLPSPLHRLLSSGAPGAQRSSSLEKKGGIGQAGPRIGGVEIPNHKRVEYSLQHIHGIGRTRSRQILLDLNLDNKVTKDLTQEEVINLRKEVRKYMIEGDLEMSTIHLLLQ